MLIKARDIGKRQALSRNLPNSYGNSEEPEMAFSCTELSHEG